jgi:mono/diheme cytochrome c family protein
VVPDSAADAGNPLSIPTWPYADFAWFIILSVITKRFRMKLVPRAWRRAPSVLACESILACVTGLLLLASATAGIGAVRSTASKNASGAASVSFGGPKAAARRAPAPPPPPPVSEENSSASALYTKLCVRCHKADGVGGKTHSTTIPDFTRPAWQRERSDHQLRVSIGDGRGPDMPSFADRLNDKELDALVAFVRGFAPTNRRGERKPNDRDFEERFRQLESEWEKMRREFWELHEAERKEKRSKEPGKTPDR